MMSASSSPRSQGWFAPTRSVRLVIRCSCGEKGRLEPGEAWSCRSCGRRWDAGQIPEDEYRAFVSSLRRLKWWALSGLVAAVIVVTPLMIFVGPALLLPGLVLLAVWYFWFLPSHRRRVRALYAAMPRWEISEGAPR